LIALEAPKLWTETRLDEVADIVRDIVDPFNIANGTTYVGLEHMESSGDFVDVGPVSNGELASAKFRFSPEHVLFGKLRPYLRKVARPTFSGVCSTDILPIKPKPGISRDYLYHYLRHPRITEEATLRCAGANLPRLSPSQLESFPFLVPFPDDPRRSLAEQKRIAAILDKADAIRRRRQSVPEQYRDLIVSRFDDAFGDPIANTRGFPTKPLEELVGTERPISYGILMPGPDTSGGVPYVRVAEMRDERIILESIRRTTPEMHEQYRRSTIRPGDILLSIRGHVGRLAMVPKALDGGNITQDTARLAIKDPDLAVFVFWLLDTPHAQRWMQSYVRGVAVKGINLGDVKRLPIMLPPPKAIAQFAKFARTAFDAQGEAIAVTKYADDLFNALVQRAFRGEL
jgi:type I restriction enzyme S subunit